MIIIHDKGHHRGRCRLSLTETPICPYFKSLLSAYFVSGPLVGNAGDPAVTQAVVDLACGGTPGISSSRPWPRGGVRGSWNGSPEGQGFDEGSTDRVTGAGMGGIERTVNGAPRNPEEITDPAYGGQESFLRKGMSELRH